MDRDLCDRLPIREFEHTFGVLGDGSVGPWRRGDDHEPGLRAWVRSADAISEFAKLWDR